MKEKDIFGNFTIRLDNKHRVICPKETKCMPNDMVVIQSAEDYDSAIRIFSYNTYRRLRENLENLRNLCIEDEKEYKIYSKRLDAIAKTILDIQAIDNQRRLLLANSIINKLDWNNVNELEFIGLDDSFLLQKK